MRTSTAVGLVAFLASAGITVAGTNFAIASPVCAVLPGLGLNTCTCFARHPRLGGTFSAAGSRFVRQVALSRCFAAATARRLNPGQCYAVCVGRGCR